MANNNNNNNGGNNGGNNSGNSAASLLTMSKDEIVQVIENAACNGAQAAVMNLAVNPQAHSQFMAVHRETRKNETPFWKSDIVKIGGVVTGAGLVIAGGVIAYNKLNRLEKLTAQTAGVITAMKPSVAEDGSIVCSNLKLSND